MHYVILSEGAYSDYNPNYYAGEIEITDAEFQAKGREIGDLVVAANELNPESKWDELMEAWLKDKGYSRLPDDIPEINRYYDFPTNKPKYPPPLQ